MGKKDTPPLPTANLPLPVEPSPQARKDPPGLLWFPSSKSDTKPLAHCVGYCW